MTIHRIETRADREPRPPRQRVYPGLWSAARQAWLERLESGPQLKAPPMSVAPECRKFGWCDWVRGPDGKVIYGDCRQVLTPLGQEQLNRWRAERHQSV